MPHPPGGDFYQDGPRLANQYLDDRVLRSYLRWRLPPTVLAELEPVFVRLGERAATDIFALGEAAEAEPPRLVTYDPWGRRVDRIEVPEAWRALERISAEEGLVAVGYERAHGALSRVDQFVRLHLFSPSSATYSCPLAMSDGAARAIELHGDEALRATALRHLTSRDPAEFWTSGQWMTERTGGSDVGGMSTVARRDDGCFRLYGTKWFTSATTSQMAMTLARVEGAPAGSRGLSLFYVELRDADGRLRDIRINRLKDKLGTRALPTAELTLDGTPARLVGGEGEGVRRIATILNITRIYNAMASAAGMRRAVALARDYATRRAAFGRVLAAHPAHVETLAAMEVECAAALHLVFHAVELLGREECGEASAAERALLRLLTPVAKLYTAKQAVAVASEALEAFGGAGYIEDTGLPRLLRDAQVLPIWEGTTNVLSLDVLRAIEKEDALAPFREALERRLAAVRAAPLAPAVERARRALEGITRYAEEMAGRGRDALEAGARGFAFALARTYAAGLLLDHAEWSVAQGDDPAAVTVALRWCAQDLTPLVSADEAWREGSNALTRY
jgi:alkylation response protein AidB-like acyl-CoA dehydrogenase